MSQPWHRKSFGIGRALFAASSLRMTAQTEKAIKISLDGLYLCRRRPTLPHTFACSTIGPAGLDFRVRDGNGYFPRGKITGKLMRLSQTSWSTCAIFQIASEPLPSLRDSVLYLHSSQGFRPGLS
jgi:hypothetical protein